MENHAFVNKYKSIDFYLLFSEKKNHAALNNNKVNKWLQTFHFWVN